jgi:hypothetical protein
MFSVNESALAPVPHVQVYVPGVTPRLLKVWPLHVSLTVSIEPET